MTTTFIRALAVGAVIHFFVTRRRAGNVIVEGEAEALWLRYPFVVLLNALLWTLMISGARVAIQRVRGLV